MDNCKFDILFYKSPQPMWVFDVETLEFLEVNESAIRIYGFSKEDFRHMTIKEIRPAEYTDDVNTYAVSSNEIHTLETLHHYKNHVIKDVEETTFPFVYQGKKCRLVYVRDISEKMKRLALLEYLNSANEELDLALDTPSALEKIAELIVPNFADFFTISLIKGEIIELFFVKHEDPEYVKLSFDLRKKNPLRVNDNSYTANVIRTKEASLVSIITDEVLKDLINDKDQIKLLKTLGLRSSMLVPMFIKDRIIGVINFLSKTEGKYYDEIDLIFAKDFANRIALVLENARLHEESKKEIKQRIEAENKKDEFIGLASHELKTPLTSLTASMQMLNRLYEKDYSSKSIPGLINTSINSLRKLTSLINDMLNVSKIEGGQLILSKSIFNLSQAIADCCHHVRLAGNHILSIGGDLNLEVCADLKRIEQVIVNFVNNAVKYSPSFKEIKLQVERVGNMAKLSVTDRGIGISEEKIPYLFDRYYRVDTSGIQFSGLGLGLFISSEIIKQHKGNIGVISELGQGSTFWFAIPLDE